MKKVLSIFKEYYYYFYMFLLIAAVASIPYSRAILSSSQIALASLWLLSGDFQKKFNKIKENKAILLLLIIFFLHVLGLIHTSDFHTAFKDIKIKLPLLLFPVIIGTSQQLKFKDIKIIITVFSISLIMNAVWGTLSYFDLTGKEIDDIQKISGKISHIRFSLMLNIAAFSTIFLFLQEKGRNIIFRKVIYVLTVFILFFFIILIHSVTGWVVFFILSVISLFYFIFKTEKKYLKIGSISLMILFLAGGIVFFIQSLKKFNTTENIDFSNLDTTTKSGNKYKNDTLSIQKENEYYVNIYLCEKELKEEWNKISNIKYSEKDKKGQFLKFTLIRYLSSKGYRKDKEGIQKLTDTDIRNVENGLTNYIFENQISVYPKLYEIFWQIEKYKKGSNPQGHSVTQRIEFIKTGIKIIKKNFWFGTGTGDVKDAFNIQYRISNNGLSEDYQLRAHNQYITFFIAFGFIGFLLFAFSYFYLPFISGKYKDYLFIIAYTLLSLSMLNEDTLETQMGVTLFALFLNLFLFSENTYSPEPSRTDIKTDT